MAAMFAVTLPMATLMGYSGLDGTIVAEDTLLITENWDEVRRLVAEGDEIDLVATVPGCTARVSAVVIAISDRDKSLQVVV